MAHNQTVSVVIPVYNSEKFLSESLSSVLDQTYADIEVIAVNDGSQDGSMDILKTFSDKITIVDQKNRGLASALQTGIERMRGNWFKWFSPDDVMYPYTVERLVAKSRELGDSYIVYSNWDMIDADGKFLRRFSETDYNCLSNFDFNVRLLDGQQINVNTSLIPGKFFGKGCGGSSIISSRRPDDPVSVDYALFLEAGLIGQMSFYLIDRPLLKYRVHSQQLSRQHVFGSLLRTEQVRRDVLQRLIPEERLRYADALKRFRREKPVSKKLMSSGLEFLSRVLPAGQIDRLLVFYLNNIRRSR